MPGTAAGWGGGGGGMGGGVEGGIGKASWEKLDLLPLKL